MKVNWGEQCFFTALPMLGFLLSNVLFNNEHWREYIKAHGLAHSVPGALINIYALCIHTTCSWFKLNAEICKSCGGFLGRRAGKCARRLLYIKKTWQVAEIEQICLEKLAKQLQRQACQKGLYYDYEDVATLSGNAKGLEMKKGEHTNKLGIFLTCYI